jgi:dinuclear metal center YbgI/SA1388 family protein
MGGVGKPPTPAGTLRAVAGRDEIVAYCSELLDASALRDMLPLGLQVPGAEDVHLVVSGVTASLELFQRAAEAGAQMVLVHHGMFVGSGPRPAMDAREKARLKTLFDHDLSLVAYHLPLDAHPEVGNNALICGLLGVAGLEPFAEHGGQPIGWIGSIDPPVPLVEVVDRVRRRINPVPMIFEDGPGQVSRIAVVSGSAAGDVVPAADAGADCFITGELKEQVMSEAREAGISVIGAGHYRTEVFGVQALGERIAERFGVEHRFVDIPNPV